MGGGGVPMSVDGVAVPLSEEGGRKGALRVCHTRQGSTLVYMDMGGGGMVLPEAVSFEWLQQV